MRRILAIGLLAAIFSLPTFAADDSPKAVPAAVVDIAKDMKKFDGKYVKVTGNVSGFEQRTSTEKAHKYVVFRLNDKESSIEVFAFGEYKFKNGDRVIVTGTFTNQNRVMKYQIDATQNKNGSIELEPIKDK